MSLLFPFRGCPVFYEMFDFAFFHRMFLSDLDPTCMENASNIEKQLRQVVTQPFNPIVQISI